MATNAVVDGGGVEWEKHADEASGAAYYYNARTGDSSWEVPAGFVSPRAQEASPDKAPKWREFVDDESGATYYYDEASGTSRWDKPDDFVSEEKEGNEETQEDREEIDDQQEEETAEQTEGPEEEPQAEKTVQHQEKEGEASGGDKTESSEKKAEGAELDKSTTAAALQWVKYVDAASSKPYYYNASTGKTQWEEPEGFDESAAVMTVPADPQVSAEYQAHLNRVRTERLARMTQHVLDPSGNLSKLNAILSGIDSSTSSIAATVDAETAAVDAPRTAKAEWQQHIDAQTQRYYYHNVVSGVTQWNKPDAPIVSGLADWVPPEVPESGVTGLGQKTVSGVNYIARAKFNRLTGKYEQLGGDDYWQNAGIAPDRAGRQMSHFFDMTELEKNREDAQRRKEQLKRKHIDWKKISAEKKAKKQKLKNEWLYTD